MSCNGLNFWLLSSLVVFSVNRKAAAESEAKDFLSHGPGGVAAAMGESVTAIPNDVTAIYYNPAGLMSQPAAIHAEHTPAFDGGRYNFFGLNYPTGVGSFGFGIIQFAVDGIEGRQNLGDQPTDLSAAQTAWFIPYSYAWKTFSLGTSLKIVNMNLAGSTGTGWGSDAGALYRKTLNDWGLLRQPCVSLGLSVKNLLEPSYALVQDEETLPRSYKAGIALSSDVFGKYSRQKSELVYDSIIVAVDIARTSGDTATSSIGLEYAFSGLWALRAGYNGESSIGVGYGNRQKAIQFDYSFVITGLGYENRFSFEYHFLQSSPRTSGSPLRAPSYEFSKKDIQRYKERFVTRGREDLLDRRYEEAAREFENAAVIDPEDPAIQEFLVRSQEGYDLVTIQEKTEAVRQSMASGDSEKATAEAMALTRQFPQDSQVQDTLGELKIYLKGKGPMAFADFQSLRSRELHWIADAVEKSIRTGDFHQMQTLLKEADTLSPDDPLVREVKARTQNAKDEIVQFHLDVASREQKKGNNAEAYFELWSARKIDSGNAKLRAQIEDLDAHSSRHRKRGAYDALYQDQLYNAAALHYIKGEYADCWKDLKELLERNPMHENGNRLKEKILMKSLIIREVN